ncbi:MAG: hypothetical protein ACLFQX_06850 [Candidatus Kapaibacterium sp.]
MERKGSLSPQVEGLFQKVKEQAADYTRAFGQIEQAIRDINRDRHNLEYLIAELSSEVGKSIESNKEATEENIRRLQDKTNKTLGLYSELDRVRELREKLESLYENVKNQADELDRTIPQFKRKAENELYATLMSVRDRIGEELSRESEKLEEKIVGKLRTLESKFIGYEKKLTNITDNQIAELNRRQISISELNDKIAEMKDLTRKINKMIIDQIDELNQQVELRIEEIHDRLESASDIYIPEKPTKEESREQSRPAISEPQQPSDIPPDYGPQIEALRRNIDELRRSAKSNENRSNIGLWLSGVAFAAIIMLIVILII